jgi:hypothetical protein
MKRAVRILLQTTIPKTEDDWSIERFSLLRDHLASIRDENGGRKYEVVARDREADSHGNDVVLSVLDTPILMSFGYLRSISATV